MRHFTDAELAGCVGADEAIAAMDEAFRAQADGRAATQPRVRTGAGAAKLSTMGAVIPSLGVAGAKVYTTVAGRFTFVILLFDAQDGRLLASFDAAALTRLRTAAVSALAARHLARADARVLAVFGTGVQADGHVEALARVRPIREIRVVSRGDASGFVARARAATGADVRASGAREALAGADIIVTATRSATPLFASADVPDGAFIAAVGATRPEVAELDADTVGRCAVVAVEALRQGREEAGDLIQATAAGRFDWSHAHELGEIVAGRAPGRRGDAELTLFESVGIGLEDVAIAGLAWRRLQS